MHVSTQYWSQEMVAGKSVSEITSILTLRGRRTSDSDN